MYIVISTAEDGDSYSIHTELGDALAAFESEKKDIEDAEFYEDTVYLIRVTPGTKFGIEASGDVYGGLLMNKFSLE